MNDDDLLTVREVAREFRVSRMTIYRMVEDGRLVHLRIGRSIRIPASALTELREAQAVRENGEVAPRGGAEEAVMASKQYATAAALGITDAAVEAAWDHEAQVKSEAEALWKDYDKGLMTLRELVDALADVDGEVL